MKVKIKRLGWIICLSGLSIAPALGQKVTIDAEIRPRAESRQGFQTPLLDTLSSAGVVQQRSRLGFNYESNSLNARVALQDARTFGETDTKSPSSVGIYEAWAEILFLPGTTFKIGRQGVQFEDGRLFSFSSWSNTGTSHDLSQLKFSMLGLDAQVGYAYNNNATAPSADTVAYTTSKMYKQMEFLHLTKSIVNGLDLSLLGVDEGFQKQTTKRPYDLGLYHRYTTGGTLNFKKDSLPVNFLLTGYYQFGKSTSVVGVDAFLLAWKAGYDITKHIGITAGTDYLSGTTSSIASTATSTRYTFNKLYGANHSFNGSMEYWATLPKGGLIDYYGGLNLKLDDKLSGDITGHGFYLAREMKVTNTDTKKSEVVSNNIGAELDVIVNYKLSAETSIQVGWCGYFINSGTKLLKYNKTSVETQFPQYAYLMLTIKPKFLVSK